MVGYDLKNCNVANATAAGVVLVTAPGSGANESSSSSSQSSSSSVTTVATNTVVTKLVLSMAPKWHYAAAGFGSGCLTRFICHPLDVLKIRFQLQVEPISTASANSKYRSITQTFSCIVREESMVALWKGHVSAQILSAIYGMAYFSSFELCTQISLKWLWTHENLITHQHTIQSQPFVHFVCGSLSGLLSTTLAHPFDVVRTRLVSQSEPKTYLNTRHAFRNIAACEGLAGLYRGFIPTVIQIMPYSGAQFTSYNLFKKLWIQQFEHDFFHWQLFGDHSINVQASFVCGAGSGIVAKFLTYPLDLIKKRLQIRGFEHARGSKFGQVPYYEGFIHCIVNTYQSENLAAFYKGLVPSLLKATITTALTFWLYESMMKVLRKKDCLTNGIPLDELDLDDNSDQQSTTNSSYQQQQQNNRNAATISHQKW